MTQADTALSEATRIIRGAKRLLVFTGAGISAESGIPTYRDAAGGLWGRYRPQDLATPEAFSANPAFVWGWYTWRRTQLRQAQPNAGHRALATLARELPQVDVVTQNVDDLHERAGSTGVLHLHGSLARARCFDCGSPWEVPADEPDEPEGGRSIEPPRCEKCGGHVRPDVVWFGEMLPQEVYQEAVRLTLLCDVMLVVGTSGQVYPAAELPSRARRAGAHVIQVNDRPSELDDECHVNLRGPAADVLPSLLVEA